jgi:hypothetical protein
MALHAQCLSDPILRKGHFSIVPLRPNERDSVYAIAPSSTAAKLARVRTGFSTHPSEQAGSENES